MKPQSHPRRSVFAVWRWPRRWIACLLFGPLATMGYLLSEAPVLRLHQERLKLGCVTASPVYAKLGIRIYDPNYAVYDPAHWLFDNSLLQTPLLQWAKLWGVQGEVLVFHVVRISESSSTGEGQ